MCVLKARRINPQQKSDTQLISLESNAGLISDAHLKTLICISNILYCSIVSGFGDCGVRYTPKLSGVRYSTRECFSVIMGEFGGPIYPSGDPTGQCAVTPPIYRPDLHIKLPFIWRQLIPGSGDSNNILASLEMSQGREKASYPTIVGLSPEKPLACRCLSAQRR